MSKWRYELFLSILYVIACLSFAWAGLMALDGQAFDAILVIVLALIARHYLNKELETLL